MKLVLVIVVMLIVAVQLPANDQSVKEPVGIVEKLGNVVPLDEQFYDEMGNTVSLRSLIDKPTIVTFVYYRCPGICSPLLTEMTKIVDKMGLEPGRDYRILTLSFDPEERPDLAADKRDNYLAEIKRPVDPASWRFLTGDSASIKHFTDAAGFYYQRSGRDWIHAGSLIMLSPEGKVTRYLYGTQFLPFDVKMAVMEASEGKTGPTIAKVLKFCFSYDPEGRTYAFNFTRVGGIVVVGMVGLFVLIFIIRPRRKTGER